MRQLEEAGDRSSGGRRLDSGRRPPGGTWPASAWVLAMLVLLGVLVATRFIEVSARIQVLASGGVVTLAAVGLAVRCGGRPAVAALLGVALTAVAAATLWPVLLAGGTVAAVVLAGCLGVMGTSPAGSLRRVPVEVLCAVVVATVLGLAAAGLDQRVHLTRFHYVVLGVALVGEFLLVHRLGDGLQGVGRRGYAVAVGALVLLGVVLAYSAALGRWGPPELLGHLDQVRHFLRTHLHAVPHPLETLLGVPALAWGVFLRARRHQGWWVCAFGAAATTPAATRFLEYGVDTQVTVLGAAYSLVIGLALGIVVIRIDLALSGGRGRRARREDEGPPRPEPGRFAPLL